MRTAAAIIYFAVTCTLTLGISIIIPYYHEFYEVNLPFIVKMLFLRGISRLAVDIPLMYQFVVCFFFFLHQKLKRYNVPAKNYRFIITVTLFLWILRGYIVICFTILYGVYLSHVNPVKELSYSFMLNFVFTFTTLYWTIDLLTAFALAYLFHCQAISAASSK